MWNWCKENCQFRLANYSLHCKEGDKTLSHTWPLPHRGIYAEHVLSLMFACPNINSWNLELKKKKKKKKKHVNFKFNWNTTFLQFVNIPLLGSSMAVAKIDSWLQGMLTLEPSGKRYFERTSALSEVSEMKAPNDYTTYMFCPYFVVQS